MGLLSSQVVPLGLQDLHFPIHSLILTVIAIIPTLVFSAWFHSTLRSKPAPRGTGQEPPVAPYFLPYLQHLLPFLRDPNTLLRSLRKKYPNTPFSLMMMNTKFHIFSSFETAALIFGKSKDFTFGPVVASMMENGLNLPVTDRPKVNVTISDKKVLKAHSKGEEDSSDFMELNHRIYTRYLTGKWLDAIIAVYNSKFHSVLQSTLDLGAMGREWKSINLHQTMRKMIFDTSTITFFGTRLPSLWPNMWDDWRRFNDAAYVGVRSNLAWYLQPKAFMARGSMLRAFDKWVDCDIDDWPEGDGVWNETWGIRMNWEREILTRKVRFSKRGRSCQQAGFLFVIITNAAPMATWFTLCIIQNSEYLARFRQEASSCLLPTSQTDPNDLRFDMNKLKNNPFIQGLWKEALRLGSISSAARVVTKDAEIEGYTVRKGSVVLLPVCLMHFDPEVFPSPEKFDPERWIINLQPGASAKEHIAAEQKQRTQAARLRSFGGGVGLCSGRYVAEQEILSTVSTMLLLFDIEFKTGHEDLPLSPRSLGIMSPATEPIIRIRAREKN